MKTLRSTFIILVCLFVYSVLLSCQKNEKFINCEGMIWNTVYHITYKGPSQLQDSILPVLNEVGYSLSVFDKNSLVTQLNENDSIKGNHHLIRVYDASKRINELSNGAFDPTVSPLVDAWGFGIGHTVSTDTLAIDSIMEFVGINKTYRKEDLIYKTDKRTRFNFSAIAKGYGCDVLGEMFKRNGVKDYMIEIGGELALSGESPTGNKWNIGVDAPLEGKNPGESTALVLSLTDVGVATSGNYRNYRKEGTRTIAHTISPITGRPFESPILSATIISTNCMEADALATACMASSLEEAETLIKMSGSQGMLIFKDSIWTSPGFNQYVLP